METIKAAVEEIIFRNDDNGYTVVSVDWDGSMETCVGTLPPLREGEHLELSGIWKNHPTYGRQFAVERCRVVPPDTEEGLVRYLASGIIPGVGEATARRMVDTFGAETLDVIHYAPQRLTEISGIGEKKAEAISEAMQEQLEQQEVMIFLQSLNLGQALCGRIYKAYGQRAADVVAANPYRLAEQIDGVGFLTADRIANQLNIGKDSPERMRAGLRHLLSTAGSGMGHTCLAEEELLDQAESLLGNERDRLSSVLNDMVLERAVILRQSEGTLYCCLPQFYYAELNVAQSLCALKDGITEQLFEDPEEAIAMSTGLLSIRLSQEQVSAVRACMDHGVTVITGGPGTGKTTVIRSILELLTQAGLKVELAAPTGRAAKRMSQASGHEARTLHRLLEYAYDGDEGGFKRDEDNPLECDAVIVDEVSMVDIFLMDALTRSMVPGMRLILVGDSDQLPSVGPGMVLSDILNSGVIPVCRLTEIFRQARESLIVMNAHRINEGIMPEMRGGKDFFFEAQPDPESVYRSVEAMIARRIPGYLGCDSMNDIQVLVPMRKGDLGVIRLNKRLQDAFNPSHPMKAQFSYGETVYREGDKVMQIKNNYQMEYRAVDENGMEEEGKGVFNGDAGVISRIDVSTRTFEVLFDDGRLVKYEFPQAEEITLSYAVSIHKSQGSEYPVVILPLFGGPEMLLTRNLLYTGVTRAKKMVVIVGSYRTVQMMVRNNRIVKRNSGLRTALCAMAGEDDHAPC